jgi:nicotinamide mononucleotide (NMN) deamidase PncC
MHWGLIVIILLLPGASIFLRQVVHIPPYRKKGILGIPQRIFKTHGIVSGKLRQMAEQVRKHEQILQFQQQATSA